MRRPITRKHPGARLLAVLLSGIIPLASAVAEEPADDLRERFKQGYQFFEAGQYRKALAIFESIRKSDPDARGSLFLSGMSHLQLLEYRQAADCFNRFLELEPEHVSGLIGGIKTAQAMGNEEWVERYRSSLFRLKSGRSDPRLEVMLNYEREIIPLAGGERLSILETFPGVGSSVSYQALMIKGKSVTRRLEWILAEGPVREAVVSMHPDRGHQTIYILAEARGDDSSAEADYKMHDVAFESLGYSRARQAFLKVLNVGTSSSDNTPK